VKKNGNIIRASNHVQSCFSAEKQVVKPPNSGAVAHVKFLNYVKIRVLQL